MEQKQNIQYIFKRWIPILIFDLTLFIILALTSLLNSQGKLDAIICGFIILLSIPIIIWAYFYSNSKIRRALQFSSPQPLISFFRGKSVFSWINLLIIPSWKPFLTSQAAIAYSLYGQFENAREELKKIEWENWPPLIRAEKMYNESIIEFLEKHDFQQGLTKAQEARRLCQISPRIPIERMPLLATNLAIEIGQALSGNPEPSTIMALESKLRRYPTLSKILIAWALEKVYSESGQKEEAGQMRELINTMAPHCKGLESI